MSGPREHRADGADPAPDDVFLTTVDAGSAPGEAHARAVALREAERGEGSDGAAFLAEIERTPSGADVPVVDTLPRPGDLLGRFTILSELGRGGMGVVYAAEDRTLGREVALKVLPASDDEERRGRFLREARSAAAVTHPGIATLYDVGEIDGRVFIAMELVRGRTLREILEARAGSPEGRALPIPEALRVAREIARALARAHARGLIHRDLKPENVMIADEGPVKLLDFGLAKQIGVLETDRTMSVRAAAEGGAPISGDAAAAPGMLTEDGSILGTPGYMSPEQAKGGHVDTRTDVFSFGVMLYELCTGSRPFPGATLMAFAIALHRDEPTPPSQRNPAVPPELERVILGCLRRAPADRYADAGAVLRDLEPPRDGAERAAPRRPWAPRVAAAALAALVLVVAGVHYGVGPWVRAREGSRAVAVDATPTPSSSSEAAVAAYRAALSAFRRGKDMGDGFERALELDPALGAAHVQLAALGLVGMTESAREHLRSAEGLRGTLGERDVALLDAVEPVVGRQPSDWAESNRRLAARLERAPGAAELWYLLGVGHGNFEDFDVAARDLERALALDPGFGAASHYLGLMLMYSGRFDEAQQTLARCLARDPGALECLESIQHLQTDQGACEAMEGTARQAIAASTETRWGYWGLANALAARGRPTATVREALRLAGEIPVGAPAAVAREYEKQRVWSQAYFEALQGDFGAAEKRAREFIQLGAASDQQQVHGRGAWLLADVLEEMGRPVEAAGVAMDFLDRRDAWEPDPRAEDGALAWDTTPSLIRTALHGGRLSPIEATIRRDVWLLSWKARLTPVSRNFLWLFGQARVVDTPETARAALDALPAHGALPPYRPQTLVDADVGRTYLLAGRAADALPWLEHATRKCEVLSYPFEHVRAHLLLAQAREATGDRPGACAAYQVVLERWGQAKPRSVTAEQARARLQALGCER